MMKILDRGDEYTTRWARTVFTRQEWPRLWQQFFLSSTQEERNQNTSKVQLNLPSLWKGSSSREKPPFQRPLGRSQLLGGLSRQSLAEHLAGRFVISMTLVRRSAGINVCDRWAAKEATVKAYYRRRLYMRDVSIQNERRPVPRSHQGCKLCALINPKLQRMILMDTEVAQKRGLSTKNRGIPGLNIVGSNRPLELEAFGLSNLHGEPQRKYRCRRAKIKEEVQHFAEISISHEREYAVAVCMVLDEEEAGSDIEYVVDDGTGEPLHEPLWGDEGFLSDELLPCFDRPHISK